MSDSEIQLNDPQTLYRRWEDSQWSPFTIDLSTDRTQWTEMTGEDRDLIVYVLSSLIVAEERITTKFSGLVGAYGSEEEATFLASQQVDEARHMQFYARFQDEAVASADLIAAHVDRARASVSDAFRHIFDEQLVQAHQRLLAEPRNLDVKVHFITLYHLILEGTLGLTTFKFTTDYLSGERLLPGFVEGYSKIHHDETRHIGYGVWFFCARAFASTRRLPTRSGKPCATCSPPSPLRLRRPTPAQIATSPRSARPARRSASSPSADSPGDSTSSASR